MSEDQVQIKTHDDKKTIDVNAVIERISTRIDRLEDDISSDLSSISAIAVEKKRFFICPNPFWDSWFQKLFALLISVKIWIMALITILLSLSLITNVQFAAILGGLVAAKGGFDIADVWRRKGSSDIIDKV